MKPTELREAWRTLSALPDGKRLFSEQLRRLVPYTGSIQPLVLDLRAGLARVQMADRPELRNHLGSLHAVALANLGELAAGLAVAAALPGAGRGILIELSLSYLKKARGTITADARAALPRAAGEHDVAVDAILSDEGGEVVARARALWRVEIPAGQPSAA